MEHSVNATPFYPAVFPMLLLGSLRSTYSHKIIKESAGLSDLSDNQHRTSMTTAGACMTSSSASCVCVLHACVAYLVGVHEEAALRQNIGVQVVVGDLV